MIFIKYRISQAVNLTYWHGCPHAKTNVARIRSMEVIPTTLFVPLEEQEPSIDEVVGTD